MNKLIKTLIALTFLNLAACELPEEAKDATTRITMPSEDQMDSIRDNESVIFEQGYNLCGMFFGHDSSGKVVEFIKIGETFEQFNGSVLNIPDSGTFYVETLIDGAGNYDAEDHKLQIQGDFTVDEYCHARNVDGDTVQMFNAGLWQDVIPGFYTR